MKLLLVAPILILLGSVQARHQQQLRSGEGGVVVKSRKLEQAFDFIVSEAAPALCITAVQGDSAFGSLELASCDFENAPPEQLWRRNGNKFVSGVGTDRCMTVNHGNSLFDGVRLRLGYCNSGLTDFTWNDGSADLLKVLNDNSFCLTCTGSTATPGDRIIAKPCLNRTDYRWTFTAATTSTGDDSPFGTLYELYCEANACVQPKNHDDTRAPIILDTCDNGRAWYVKEKGGGIVKFHSAIDPTLCLQAGFCSAQDGTWLRLMECVDDNCLQDFTWQDYEAPIKLAGSDLCMVYQGSTAEVGDIMIMKNCNVRSYEWSGNAIE